MSSFSFDGTTVLFPHSQPYEPQMEVMKTVVGTLRDKANALVESPTGTGKTLALLSAAMGWSVSVKAEIKAIEAQIELDNLLQLSDSDDSDITSTVTESPLSSPCKPHKQQSDLLTQSKSATTNNRQQSPEARSDLSQDLFGKSQIEPQATNTSNLNNRNTRSEDSNSSYPPTDESSSSQQQMGKKKRKHITIGERRLKKRQPEIPKKPLLMYMSRTHTQLKQVHEELLKTEYSGASVTHLAARTRYCVNESARSAPEGIDAACASRRQNKRSLDPPYNKISCTYYNGDPYCESDANSITDIEALQALGRKQHFCPYYYSLGKASRADVILSPYNYLFGFQPLRDLFTENSAPILIIDEAHNFSSSIEEKYTYKITAETLNEAEKNLSDAYIRTVFRINTMDQKYPEPKNTSDDNNNNKPATVPAPLDKSIPVNSDSGGQYVDAASASSQESSIAEVELNPLTLRKMPDSIQQIYTQLKCYRLTYQAAQKIIKTLHSRFQIVKSITEPQNNDEVRPGTKALDRLPWLLGHSEEMYVSYSKRAAYRSYEVNITPMVSQSTQDSLTCTMQTLFHADDQSKSQTSTTVDEDVAVDSNFGPYDVKEFGCGDRKLDKLISNDVQILLRTMEVIGSAGITTWHLGIISSFLYGLYSTSRTDLDTHFKDVLQAAKTKTKIPPEFFIQLMCLTPKLGMEDLSSCNGVKKSLILASGTLAPLKHTESQLGQPFKYQLRCNHVIDQTQIMCRVLTKFIPSGRLLNGKSENRNQQYYNYLAMTIAKTLEASVPGGVLVFLPSKFDKDKCYKVFKEKQMTDIDRPFKDYKIFKEEDGGRCDDYFTLSKKGERVLCLAVFRGSLSEGHNFPNDVARVVFIIGVPFRAYDTYSRQKIIYERHSNSNWYESDALRAANQALGRCIRSISDYGAIIFCDSRYNEDFSLYYPTWVCQGRPVRGDNHQMLRKELNHFFYSNDLRFNNLTKRPFEFYPQQRIGSQIVNSEADSPCSLSEVDVLTPKRSIRPVESQQHQEGEIISPVKAIQVNINTQNSQQIITPILSIPDSSAAESCNLTPTRGTMKIHGWARQESQQLPRQLNGTQQQQQQQQSLIFKK